LENSIFNWSSGKDSAMALFNVLNENDYSVSSLFTSVSNENNRISMHGIRSSLLEKQAQSIGIPLQKLMLPELPSMEAYDELVAEQLRILKNQGITHSIYGDIFLEDLRNYREEQLLKVGMNAVFPLWKKNSTELINEIIETGFKAIIVCIDERYLDNSFLGRVIDREFINNLPENVDPCGENGEYHSFVFDGPLFSQPIKFLKGEVVYKKYKSHSTDDIHKNIENGFWFCDLTDN
jgi:uncharacterized protein (TIGR00290 family)